MVCPIRGCCVQFGGFRYAPALVALYTNDNATRVGESRLFFEQLARCLAGPSGSAGTAQPLEMSYVTRVQ